MWQVETRPSMWQVETCPYPRLEARGAGTARDDPRAARENRGDARAFVRLDRDDEVEGDDVRPGNAHESRGLEPRFQGLQSRVDQMVVATRVQRHVIVAC